MCVHYGEWKGPGFCWLRSGFCCASCALLSWQARAGREWEGAARGLHSAWPQLCPWQTPSPRAGVLLYNLSPLSFSVSYDNRTRLITGWTVVVSRLSLTNSISFCSKCIFPKSCSFKAYLDQKLCSWLIVFSCLQCPASSKGLFSICLGVLCNIFPSSMQAPVDSMKEPNGWCRPSKCFESDTLGFLCVLCYWVLECCPKRKVEELKLVTDPTLLAWRNSKTQVFDFIDGHFTWYHVSF